MGPKGLVAFIVVLQGIHAEATCFFPPEYIGEFVMQKTPNNDGYEVQYSTINISFTGTPLWGTCWRRYDNNFIFTLSAEERLCLRCLNLELKSRNVLQIRATDLSKCFTTEQEAVTSCPADSLTKNDGVVEIILFKTQDQLGYPIIKEFCPIDERYTVMYRSENKTSRCMMEETVVDMCPSASEISLNFEKCTDGFGFNLTCIGQWKGKDGRHYLALEDTRQKPTYRCALFEKDETTGIVNIALSKDSTCDADLESATKGFETLKMTPAPQDDLPWIAETENEVCRFPSWMQGKWEHVIVEHNTFIYREQTNFIKYDLRCLGSENETKYMVHVRTQCKNEKSYSCLWAQQRDDNVFEFQFGLNASLKRDERLCRKKNFGKDDWITQGRKEPTSDIKCPISGIFTGVIPDITSFCSKLSSDCKTPDLMYYKVYDCKTLQLYEEREYRCLGHWTEGDQLYTYTKRQDKVANGTFECFVGSIISDDHILIREAGEHCQRKMEGVTGMKLTKQKQYSKPCVEANSNNVELSTEKTIPYNVHTTRRTTYVYGETTSPTTPTRTNSSAAILNYSVYLILSIVMIIY